MSYPQPPGSPYPSVQPPNPYGAFGDPNQPPPQRGNGCLWIILGSILAGCVLMVAICGIGGYYAYRNAKSMIAGVARTVVVQAVEDSELSAEDKQEVVTQIDRVVEAYKRGEISDKDLENVFKELQDSPLIPIAVMFGLDKKYLEKSGLKDDEKADARKQLQRLVRGGMQEKISSQAIEKLMQPLQEPGPNNEKRLKEKLTDEEIRTFIADAKQLADDADIPDEEFKVDIGDEVKRLVDNALGKNAE